MIELLLPIILLLAGFILIYVSADSFTDSSARIASIYKVSPLLIGILILGFGTSAPEIVVSFIAAYEKHPGLSVGNAFGSNIFNIALVLGITAMLKPIEIKWQSIKKEWWVLLIFSLIAGLLLWDERDLSQMDGLILIGLLVTFLVYTYYISRKDQHKFDNLPSNVDSDRKWRIWSTLIISLAVLLVSAQAIVFGGTEIAEYFGAPDLIVGLSLVAIGTSIPELAVSVSAVYKNQHEMVVGNIIGSNIFNTVAVLAIPGLISTSAISLPDELFYRDSAFIIILTIALGLAISQFPKKDQIWRHEGYIFIGILCFYLYFLFKPWTL